VHFRKDGVSGRGFATSGPRAVVVSHHRMPTSPRDPFEERPRRPSKEPFVLIVEDERDERDALSAWLVDQGFATFQARNGEEALDFLHAGRHPALILLDIKMPVMDGKEFLRQMAEEEAIAEIPVTILTASATMDELPFRKKDAGFFLKPVDHERLLKTVRSYCG
jgi:two-component system, chemotaxis family, chemotaxis protein CheY